MVGETFYDGRLKRCNKCFIYKEISEFYIYKQKTKKKLMGRCKACDKKVKPYHKKAQKKYRLKFPGKATARTAVAIAVKTGTLIRPDDCEKCGGDNNGKPIHAHHWDYRKPLCVTWLCVPCHSGVHNGK